MKKLWGKKRNIKNPNLAPKLNERLTLCAYLTCP
jgi:hypothetical protein